MPFYFINTPQTTGTANLISMPVVQSSADIPTLNNRIASDIKNYWGSPEKEIFFGCKDVSFNTLKANSPTGHVALRCKYLTHPNRLSAHWVSFDNTNRPPDSSETYYFVLGGTDMVLKAGNNAYVARIRQDNNGHIYINFTSAIIDINGTGGGGSAGVNIPQN